MVSDLLATDAPTVSPKPSHISLLKRFLRVVAIVHQSGYRHFFLALYFVIPPLFTSFILAFLFLLMQFLDLLALSNRKTPW